MYVLYTAASGTYLALEVLYTREAEKFTAYSINFVNTTLCTELYSAISICRMVTKFISPGCCRHMPTALTVDWGLSRDAQIRARTCTRTIVRSCTCGHRVLADRFTSGHATIASLLCVRPIWLPQAVVRILACV